MITSLSSGFLNYNQLQQDGNVEEATGLYNQALEAALKSQDSENVYFIKQELGMIAFSLQKYKDAEMLFLEVESYLSDKKRKNDILNISRVMLKLAEIYENFNNFEKAEQYYKECATNLKSKVNNSEEIKDEKIVELWLLFLSSEAHYYLHRENFEKAQKYFKQAYEFSLRTQGEVSEYTVTFLYQLGAVSFQKGELEIAVDYLEKASELGKHLPGMIELSNVFITLGNIYLKQGFTKKAEKLCTEGYKNATRHKYKKGIEESSACLKELKDAFS
ncbi:hypothetical protein PGB90_010004 [Kerria lacca]